MTAIVMNVTNAMAHPNADALRLYKMSAPGYNETQIIANLENVYEVGDRAIVVFAGATLKDGTTIRDAKIRGIASYGMALGKTDLLVGTDVTAEHCRDDSVDGFRMLTWPSIESLFNVRRSLQKTGTERVVSYLGKIKLDGTNAAVQISTDGRVAAQSRSNIITPEQDNMGFARWVADNKEYFSKLASTGHLTIFGEWCGKGIQKGTAIAQLDRKVFAVFAIQHGGVNGEPAVIEISPNTIAKRLGTYNDIYVLPWATRMFILDFRSTDDLQVKANEISALVSEIETCDPWVKATLNIEGIGEGLVMYPIPSGEDVRFLPDLVDAFEYSDLVFKAKGEKHKVVKTKEIVQINPEVAKSVSDFVALFATEARLNQIADKAGLDTKNTGNFLREFSMDVQKESVAELEASGLEWKQVAKDLSTEARKWFIGKFNIL